MKRTPGVWTFYVAGGGLAKDEKIAVLDSGIHLTRSINVWHHEVEVLSNSKKRHNKSLTIYGFNCFESDFFYKSVSRGKNVAIGDIVIVGSAGGYDIPSSNIWIRPLPAIYGLHEQSLITIRMQQIHQDMRKNCLFYNEKQKKRARNYYN